MSQPPMFLLCLSDIEGCNPFFISADEKAIAARMKSALKSRPHAQSYFEVRRFRSSGRVDAVKIYNLDGSVQADWSKDVAHLNP